jgi:hypothetical protein
VGVQPSQPKKEPGSSSEAEDNPQSLTEINQLSHIIGFGGIPPAALLFLFLGSGISFLVLFRSRRGSLITGGEPLLTT